MKNHESRATLYKKPSICSLFANALLGFLLSLILFNSAAGAVSFNKTFLIDDYLFTKNDSMTVAQIQTWLESKGSLLANWKDNINMKKSDGCVVHKATGMTAAEIIYEAANNWGAQIVNNCSGSSISYWDDVAGYQLETISPKALLVTLEKEQGLISASGSYSGSSSAYVNPCSTSEVNASYGGDEYSCYINDKEYKIAWAMGYAVPDTGGKNHKYKGFYNQINWAAWQLRFNYERSKGNTDWDNAGHIYYDGPMTKGSHKRCETCPTSNFDGYYPIDNQNIYMSNGSTASLYRYTPHTYPGFHGNYNFVQFYSSWFGSIYLTNPYVSISSGLSVAPGSPVVGQTATANFTIQNTSSDPVNVGTMMVTADFENGQSYDFSSTQNLTVPANSTLTYSKTRNLPYSGEYDLKITNWRPGVGWNTSYPKSKTSSTVRAKTIEIKDPNVVITEGMTLSKTNPDAGETITATVKLRNDDSLTSNVNDLNIIAKNQTTGAEFAFGVADFTLAAGASATYTKTKNFPWPGKYDLRIVALRNGKQSTIWPKALNNTVYKTKTITVNKPSVGVIEGLSLSDSTPKVGQSITAKFKLRNWEAFAVRAGTLGVAVVNLDTGERKDFTYLSDVSLPGASDFIYSKTRTFTKAGKYKAYTVNKRPGFDWTKYYPVNAGPNIKREIYFTVSK